MAMSRRKQLRPKSLKEGDETMFVLPDELKCDEESHDIVARIDIEQEHRFGPFPAILISCQQQQQQQHVSSGSDSTNVSCMIMQIDNETLENGTQSFQLLDNKHNWLTRCSASNNASSNLDITFQNEQIYASLTQSIKTGTRLCSNTIILPKLTQIEESQIKQESKLDMNNSTDIIKVKQEPIESEEEQPQANLSSSSIKSDLSMININGSKSKETKKLYPLLFTCDDCGIRYSNRSTLEAHRQHYCTKRETTKIHATDSTMTVKVKGMKRKHIDINDSSPLPSPTKRLSLSSNDAYCSECDILFSKPDNLLQHKLHYCGTKSSSSSSSSLRQINENISNSFRPPIPFDRPIQIGPFIYVPVPIVSSKVENSERSKSPINDNKPLDLSKPKKQIDEGEQQQQQQQQRQISTKSSSSPLDLTIEKSTSLFNILNSSSTITKASYSAQQQIYECDYCSIRFSSLKTLHAHQENYCIEYRKQKKNANNNSSVNTSTIETKVIVNDSNRSQSPPISTTISRTVSLSPNDSVNSSYLPPHRSSPFMCRLCKYRGNTLRGMRMHFKFHLSNNEPCSDDDIIITSTINNSLPIPSTQLLLKCTICSAMFDHEDALLNHIKCVHTKESLLECLECQSRFCSKWNLLRHMKLTHTNMKCDEEEQDDSDECIVSNDTHIMMNEPNNEQKSDEDRDLSSSSPLSSSNNKSSDPMNLTRNVLIESVDVNSMKKISDGILLKKKFACPYCHIKFGSIDTLKQHMTNYCSSRPTNEDQSNNKKKTNETFCSTCQIPFRHKSSYDAHKMYYCRGSNKVHVKMQA
ncbi:unnamed protein product [Rotaria socialis]|uniref:C2H2-type domain-containing protein n=1 Tax=Rotaria socialis TaxID=392032 RepID=A0A821KHR5_9BILA|nr:unnamed protein product [Rotaria socialis]CAF4735881.1 unnamed protein product [Rotaria socialis]